MKDPTIERLEVTTYRLPTERTEADGTLSWDSTTTVVVHARGGGHEGMGWSYTSRAAAMLVKEVLAPAVTGVSAFAVDAACVAMERALRNVGRRGAGAHAMSAVDIALWDLKARVLGVSLTDLMGGVRDSVPVYGSGGFTNTRGEALEAQLISWLRQGVRAVKIKIGRDPVDDHERVRTARQCIGPEVELFVDANGAYNPREAARTARWLADYDVRWFEEPCSSDDTAGLRFVREQSYVAVAAGEYSETPDDVTRLLGCVDTMQLDATRCGGFSGFLRGEALCDAMHLPVSAHCAPQLHARVGCASRRLAHVESFFDHERVESRLFDGCLPIRDGALHPSRSHVGHGMTLKAADAKRFVLGG